jgi:methylated-DNA-protein-cysteine methyltransferase related protein
MHEALSPDANRILETVARVPAGRVATYGQIATLAGLPRRARLVGTTLRVAGNVELPWHRILRADGRIAFPAGSAPFDEQRRRLKREGVPVKNGRVDLASYGWRRERALDEVLWGPDTFAPPRKRTAKLKSRDA